MADRQDFDKDMDEYISGRTNSGFLSGFLGTKKEQKEEVKLASETAQVQQYNEPVEPEKLDEKPKKSWFKSLFRGEDSVVVEEQQQPKSEVYHQDVKEIVRISLEVVKLLPKENLEQFKQSENFSRLKELLRKHQFIK